MFQLAADQLAVISACSPNFSEILLKLKLCCCVRPCSWFDLPVQQNLKLVKGCNQVLLFLFDRPDLIDMNTVAVQSNLANLENAFFVAEKLGVARLLDPEGKRATDGFVAKPPTLK